VQVMAQRDQGVDLRVLGHGGQKIADAVRSYRVA